MKKIIAIILSSFMILSLVGCGNKNEEITLNEEVVSEVISAEVSVSTDPVQIEVEEKVENDETDKKDDLVSKFEKINKIYKKDWTPASEDLLGTASKKSPKIDEKNFESIKVKTSFDFSEFVDEEFDLGGIHYRVARSELTKLDNKEAEILINDYINDKVKEYIGKDLDWKKGEKYEDYERNFSVNVNTSILGNILSVNFYVTADMVSRDDDNFDYLEIFNDEHYFTYDLKNNKELKLSDLFYSDVRYVEVINSAIRDYMDSINNEDGYTDFMFETKRPFMGIPDNFEGFYMSSGNLMISFGKNNPYFEYGFTIPMNLYTYQNDIFIEDLDTSEYLRTDEFDEVLLYESDVEKTFEKIMPFLMKEHTYVYRIESGLKDDVIKKINKYLIEFEKRFSEKEVISRIEEFQAEDFLPDNYIGYLSSYVFFKEDKVVFNYYYSINNNYEADPDNYENIMMESIQLNFDNKTGELLTVVDVLSDKQLETLKNILSEEEYLTQEEIDKIDEFTNFYVDEVRGITLEFNDSEHHFYEFKDLK